GIEALDDRGDVFLRDGAPEDVVDKLQARLAALEVITLEELLVGRAEREGHLGEQTGTPGLLLEALGMIDRSRQRFLIVDLGSPLVAFDFEFAAKAVDDDLEVKLAHPADDG